MKRIKKIAASLMTVAMATGAMMSMSADAAMTADVKRNVTWSSSTSGSTTTYTAQIYTRLATNEYVTCDAATLIGTNFRHYTSEWNATTTNNTSTTRYQTTSTQIYNIKTGQWIYSAADADNGNTTAGGQRSATSTYSNYPDKYYLYWSGSISSGASQYSPTVQEVEFYEMHT